MANKKTTKKKTGNKKAAKPGGGKRKRGPKKGDVEAAANAVKAKATPIREPRDGDVPRYHHLYQPSPALAKLIGSEPRHRTLLERELWAHVKINYMVGTRDRTRFEPVGDLIAVFGEVPDVTKLEIGGYADGHIERLA